MAWLIAISLSFSLRPCLGRLVGCSVPSIHKACDTGRLRYTTPVGSHLRLIAVADANDWLAGRGPRYVSAPTNHVVQIHPVTLKTYTVPRGSAVDAL